MRAKRHPANGAIGIEIKSGKQTVRAQDALGNPLPRFHRTDDARVHGANQEDGLVAGHIGGAGRRCNAHRNVQAQKSQGAAPKGATGPHLTRSRIDT